MSDKRHTRASEIFLAVCDLDPDSQERRLLAECKGDIELHALLEGMLAADGRGALPIDRPALMQFPQMRAENPGAEAERTREIAGFRVLGELGRGGMGIVYEAQQEHPHRRVALKLVRSVLASSEVLLRFEQEAKMLGWLNHPGIAQIYGAGLAQSPEGPQPYFAMELVRGLPVTQFASENDLGLRERLMLVERICHAVHHAHQKGVVHRDLKPSNILVGSDGPKILDFGVARAIDADPDSSFSTRTGVLLGTLSYMSPEQMLGDPAQLDTRSDIYSLGVLSYELVTGRLPHDVGQLPLAEAMRIVRDEEPLPASKTARNLPSDVDTILGKALAKEKEERYSSAEALADDLRRFLDHEPIAARPHSTFYYVCKFGRRNRALVSAIAAALVILIAATVFSTMAAIGQSRAADLAQERLVEEQRQTAIAEAVNNFLNQDLLGAVDPNRQGRDVTMREVLDIAAAKIEDRFGEQPVVEAEIRFTIGDTYLNLGRHDLAAPFFLRSLELREEVLGEGHPDTLDSYSGLGRLMLQLGRLDEAERYARRCLDLRRELLGPEAELTLRAQRNLAAVYKYQGRTDEALESLLEVLEIAVRTLGPDAELRISSLEGVAGTYKDMRRMEEAIPLYQEVLEDRRRVAPGKPGEIRALNNLAVAYLSLSRLSEAEPLFSAALDMSTDLSGEEHPLTIACMSNLARVYEKQGDFELAEPLFERALKLNREVNGIDHRGTLIVTLYQVDLYRHMGRLAEAESALLEAHALSLARYGASFPVTLSLSDELIELYGAWGKPTEASIWRQK